MSSVPAAVAASGPRAPKRARGHARVAAILDAGSAVLAEKGYDAATMTEIAARSDTAIGSLYRFFPTKAALADALLARHAEQLGASLATLEAQASGMTPAALADALITFMLDRGINRDLAVTLVDVHPEGPSRRAQIRETARRGIASILTKAAPDLPPTRAADVAAVVLQMIKGARPLAEIGPAPVGDLRTAVCLYLAFCCEEACENRKHQ